jgi:hypothetical protein
MITKTKGNQRNTLFFSQSFLYFDIYNNLFQKKNEIKNITEPKPSSKRIEFIDFNFDKENTRVYSFVS